MKAYRSAVTIVICIIACHVIPMAAQMYSYGSGVDTETVNLVNNGAECMDFSKVRIMNNITSTTGSLGDLLTSSGKLCISFNGGLAFSETAIPTGTYGPVVTGSMSQEAAILPLYFNYGTNINFNDDQGTSGIFYTVSTDATTLQTYVNDISSCGLAVNDFKAFWAVKVTWANLQDATNQGLFDDPSLSNTFQVVLLGNAGDALFVIINYGKITAVPSTTVQTLIQGDGANVFTWTADTTGGNCNPAFTPGRFVYYISDDSVRQPSDPQVCDGTVNCGHYYGLVSTGSGPLSGNCAGSVCNCVPDHSGIYCLNDMTNECAPSPCDPAHSLFCEDTGLGSEVTDPSSRYRCYCDVGYTGAICDTAIQACDSNPCMNGGTCENIPYDFRCHCPPEWAGTKCHEDVDECALSPCQNGGTCTNNAGGYTCDCPDGVFGDNCECGGWEPWSTKCQAPAGWDGTCGGCGEQYRTRTCGVGSTDDLMETRSCNMRCCDRSLYSEKTERRYATSDTGMPITKIRPRFCCYKFPSLQRVTKDGGKRCEYVTGGFC